MADHVVHEVEQRPLDREAVEVERVCEAIAKIDKLKDLLERAASVCRYDVVDDLTNEKKVNTYILKNG